MFKAFPHLTIGPFIGSSKLSGKMKLKIKIVPNQADVSKYSKSIYKSNNCWYAIYYLFPGLYGKKSLIYMIVTIQYKYIFNQSFTTVMDGKPVLLNINTPFIYTSHKNDNWLGV